MFFYGIDWTYIILVVPTLIFTLWASAHVRNTFQKFSKVRNSRGLTGAQAAYAVLRANGITDVRIERIAGDLTDHYDPKTNVIRLSDSVYDAPTPAAVGVAAHEAGHAVQYAQNYLPVKIRSAIVNVTNIGSKLSLPLVIIGILMMSIRSLARFSQFFYYIAVIGVLLYGLCVVFQLVTLPTEFNASRRALRAIDGGNLLDDTDRASAKKVLSAAALTYVAALATSLAQFLRLFLMVNRRRN